MIEHEHSPTPPSATDDVAEHAERAHAPISPSTLKPRSVCVGFKNDPDSDKTLADRGTFGHECVEHETPGRVLNDPELRAGVNFCIALKRALINEQYEYPNLPARVLQEVCLYYFDQWGFVDLVVLNDATNPSHAEVADWKFARNFYAADSGQFWAYAVGLWNRYPTLDTVSVHVAHPFLDRIDRADFSREAHYELLSAKIAAVIAAVRRNDASDYRVTSQCGYCGAARNCSKLAKLAVEVIQASSGGGLDLPEDAFDSPQIEDPKVMAALLAIRAPLDKATKAWGKHSLEMWNGGTEIPGYELAERHGRATMGDAHSVYELVKDRLSFEDFLAACKVSQAELLDLYGSTAPHGSKGKFQQALRAQLEDAELVTFGDDSHFLRKKKSHEE